MNNELSNTLYSTLCTVIKKYKNKNKTKKKPQLCKRTQINKYTNNNSNAPMPVY